MPRQPNYATILAAHKDAARLAQSTLDVLAGDRALSAKHRLDCLIASDALETAIDLAGSRAAIGLQIKETLP